MNRPLVLAISGGSGAVYAVRLLQILLEGGREVHLMISPAGRTVLWQELGIELNLEQFDPAPLLRPWSELPLPSEYRSSLVPTFPGSPSAQGPLSPATDRSRLHYHHYQNFLAPAASGSFRTAGMVICPCSGSTVSGIAHGSSNNLIQRAADVHLKERRPLVLVPRETPLSAIQLDNMRRCAEAGAVVLPAMPGFYHGPRSIGDLVDFIVARICDQLDVPVELMRRWGEIPGGEN